MPADLSRPGEAALTVPSTLYSAPGASFPGGRTDVTSDASGPKTMRVSMLTASGRPTLKMTFVLPEVVTWMETGRRNSRRASSGLWSAFRAGHVPDVIWLALLIFHPWAVYVS